MFYSLIVGALRLLTVYCLMRSIHAFRHAQYRSAAISLLAAIVILVLIFAPIKTKPVTVTLPISNAR